MKTFLNYIIESNELAVLDSDFSNLSFEEFLQQLTTDPQTGRPLTLKSFSDKASWLSLYMGNKYGFSARDGKDAQVQKLIEAINTYFFRRIMWPNTQPLRAKKDVLYASKDFREFNQKLAYLTRDIMVRRREGGDISELESYKDELREQTPHRAELNALDKQIQQHEKEAYSTPLTPEYYEPSDEVNGEAYTVAYNLYQDLRGQ